jgi:hypothetical protein
MGVSPEKQARVVAVGIQVVHGAGIRHLWTSGLGGLAGGPEVSGTGLSRRPRRAFSSSSGVSPGKIGFRE